jgi:bifunctional DNA-binding transcriptional regulator/antitoxin component of YhaV-PrlF toxin-antitoxin module
MIRSFQKVIKVGSSGGVLLPAKELKRHNIAIGDEVEVIIYPRPKTPPANADDRQVISLARIILEKYHRDFHDLAGR